MILQQINQLKQLSPALTHISLRKPTGNKKHAVAMYLHYYWTTLGMKHVGLFEGCAASTKQKKRSKLDE